MRWLMELVIGSLWFGGVAVAHPTMALPEVSLGENPYRSFTGEVVGSEPHVLAEIPEGQDFIITTMDLGQYYEVLRGTTVVVSGRALDSHYVRKGISRLRIEGGSTLALKSTYFVALRFHVEGYFASAGGPYRFANGVVYATEPETFFTNDSDRDFVVRTMMVMMDFCKLYLGDTAVLLRGDGMYDGSDWAYVNRRGGLVVPPGMQLSLSSYDSSVNCPYLMEGEYIML